MNPSQQKLTHDMIERPDLWTLAMRIDDGNLHVLLTTAMPQQAAADGKSIIYRAIPLDSSASSPLTALENAVYDNDLLLSDFAEVHWVWDSDYTLIIPSEASPEQARLLFDSAFSHLTDSTLLTEPRLYPTVATNAAIVAAFDAQEAAFLRRSFADRRFVTSLGVLIDYFITSAGRGNGCHEYINFRPTSIDVIIIDRTKLIHAATFDCSSAADAAYYALACRRLHGLTGSCGPLLLCGESPLRDEASEILRRHVDQVLPAIFPSDMMRTGDEASRAPFELTASLLVSSRLGIESPDTNPSTPAPLNPTIQQ